MLPAVMSGAGDGGVGEGLDLLPPPEGDSMAPPARKAMKKPRGVGTTKGIKVPGSPRPPVYRGLQRVVAPPDDPGLESFLRLIGELAADEVLKIWNSRKNVGLPPLSIDSPGGFDRRESPLVMGSASPDGEAKGVPAVPRGSLFGVLPHAPGNPLGQSRESSLPPSSGHGEFLGDGLADEVPQAQARDRIARPRAQGSPKRKSSN